MPKAGGQIIVNGATWCPDCQRAKRFFGEHRVKYRWVDIEQDPGATACVEPDFYSL